jgi:hypothetical protein
MDLGGGLLFLVGLLMWIFKGKEVRPTHEQAKESDGLPSNP